MYKVIFLFLFCFLEIMNLNLDLDTNILNLKIISQIKEYDKLSTKDELVKITSPSLINSISRWYNSENRNITIEKLNMILNKTFEITEYLLNNENDKESELEINNLEENNSQIFQKFIIEMTNCLNGLENLKKTYAEDILITSQLDLLINKLNIRIEKMTKLFKINLD